MWAQSKTETNTFSLKALQKPLQKNTTITTTKNGNDKNDIILARFDVP